MTTRLRTMAALALCLWAGQGLAAELAATWSFGAGANATVPKSLTTPRGKIVVDLSALPKGASVFRAVLRARRWREPGWQTESDKVVVVPADAPQEPLRLLPPRHRSLDATKAVARATRDGRSKVELLIRAFQWWKKDTTRLDVSFTGGKARNGIPKAAGLAARHSNGQTLLTWAEPKPAIAAQTMTFAEWGPLVKELAAAPSQTTYRVYRSGKRIDPATIADAELVDEVGRLTCWNGDFHGTSPPKDAALLRYVVEDAKAPVPPGTGIYAHNPPKAGKAYYAVSVAVDGEEDLSAFGGGNALAAPVDEGVGPGDPVLQRIEKPERFFYTEGIALHYYTRWEAPPRCNRPSQPYDYLVVVPEKVARPAPLNLVLHCWGSNLYGKGGAYSWFGWQDRRRGIGVASNQIPYDWWTCCHEHRGTWKPWTEGVNRNFTATRLLAFGDWVSTRWEIDATRLCVSGESMGGAGSTFLPIRYPRRFAYAFSSVGIHNPAAIKGGFHESYARVCGRMEAKIAHESGMDTWDYLSDPLLVRKSPGTDLPFIGFGNGKNDHGIGWPHVVDLAKALQEARQPHAVVWRMRGHGSGTFYPRGIDFSTAKSLPAFTRCSLDDDIGTATRLAEPKPFKNREGKLLKDLYDGDSEGQINTFLRWRADDLVDEAGRWEATVYLAAGRRGAPKRGCTVDLTPRRCQKFKAKPGEKVRWSNVALDGNKELQSGTTTADKWGLVTIEKLTIADGKHRVRIRSAE